MTSSTIESIAANEQITKARGLRGAGTPTKAKLTYFQENYLQLDLQYKDVVHWVRCFSVPNVTLPQVAYLGFSAHCGELSGMPHSIGFFVTLLGSYRCFYTQITTTLSQSMPKIFMQPTCIALVPGSLIHTEKAIQQQ